MATVKYEKWTGDDWDSLSLEELLDKLSSFMLQSGFYDQFQQYYRQNYSDRSLDALKQAILQALLEMEMLPEEWRKQAEQEQVAPELQKVLDRLIERMVAEGYIRLQQDQFRFKRKGKGGAGPESPQVHFEMTDKSLDFLGFKTLKDLMGSLGKSSFGRHETDHLSTGVETTAAAKPYEFGDTLNLDVSATLLSTIQRSGLKVPLEVDYADLHVHQSEYQSSCATVLLLDTSHSMILYGEDRFTPAKRVALALMHLIRTQFPGDSLALALFHDSAEEIPLGQLVRVKVGPYYTNTCEGLRLAQRILARQRKDMRQIIMITDGKPSALTMPNGRVYKNAFGLDPMIIGETFKEAANCRRQGILINTFMLASDPYLVEFVKKVAEICRGKAYFASTFNLGKYILMDYMRRKTRTVH
ncbi:MAG: vWA domain-containing protein [Acidobacteriota bacterium]